MFYRGLALEVTRRSETSFTPGALAARLKRPFFPGNDPESNRCPCSRALYQLQHLPIKLMSVKRLIRHVRSTAINDPE